MPCQHFGRQLYCRSLSKFNTFDFLYVLQVVTSVVRIGWQLFCHTPSPVKNLQDKLLSFLVFVLQWFAIYFKTFEAIWHSPCKRIVWTAFFGHPTFFGNYGIWYGSGHKRGWDIGNFWWISSGGGSDREHGGTGLGLSITEQFAELWVSRLVWRVWRVKGRYLLYGY